MSGSMGMGFQMRPELQQKLILAPRMIQSMEILQLPIMALQERIQTEMEENPVLELKSSKDDSAPDGDNEFGEANGKDVSDPSSELVIDANGDGQEDFDRLSSINDDWSDHFNEEHRPSRNRIEEESEKKHLAEVNMLSRPQSLQDNLFDQLALLDCPSEEMKLARHLISYIHKSGYLLRFEVVEKDGEIVEEKVFPVTLEEIAQTYEEPVEIEDVEDALALIQRLDPPGVGARDLRECLLLQINDETPMHDVLRVLIDGHLEDIQHNRLPNIQRKTGFDLETIREGIDELRHLDPKPGSRFREDNVQYIVPDILVELNDSGEYEVKLTDDWTPQVYISKRYRDLCRNKKNDPGTREFLKRKIQAAEWLREAIEQRRSTLLKVSTATITHQREFLDHGPEFIKPLKMEQIADQVGVHVTTVSRAVHDKWMQTPRGVFPLKRFFGGGTQSSDGEEVAWETIKRKLLDLIENEDKSSPLSDEDLVHKLNEAGYPVARRTVTKYRKQLDIPSSRQRKIWS